MKNPVITYKLSLLVLLAFFFQWGLNAASLSVVEIEEKAYISLDQFLSVDSRISGKIDHLTLVVEIHYKGRKVRLKIGAPFYISEGERYLLEYPPVIREGKIFIPAGLAEELLSELGIPVKYRYENREILTHSLQTRERKLHLDFVVIDPGHGGKDPGASGFNSLQEKEITLQNAQYLFHYLQKKLPDTKIYITRYNDKFLSLSDRVEIANKKLKTHSFGIFISLHCNAHLQTQVNGYEIYYLAQNADSEEARRVMLKENLAFGSPPVIASIESILFDSQLMAESKVLARALNRTFMTQLDGLISARGVKRADFAVLRGVMMPAVLVEMGYISNRNESTVLRSDNYRQKLSSAILQAVGMFMENIPKM